MSELPDAGGSTTLWARLSRRLQKAGDAAKSPTEIDLPPLPPQSEGPSIRLLEVRPGKKSEVVCSLSVHRLCEAPPFYALSYCWGEERESHSISCNGLTFRVRRNLYEALAQLRQMRYTVLWVDAICIDQANTTEKNHQVRLMSKIYSQALATVAWLGFAQPHQDRVIEYINLLSDVYTKHFDEVHKNRGFYLTKPNCAKWGLPPWRSVQEPLLEPLFHFLTLPYFSRAWVVQECALARKSPHLIQGTQELDWHRLEHAIRILIRISGWKHYAGKDVNQIRFREIYGVRQKISAAQEGSECADTAVSSILLYHRRARCSDPRDRVYSILGVLEKIDVRFSGTQQLLPDYSVPFQKVYAEFARKLLDGATNLDILLQPRPADLVQHSMPSWVPDFNTTRQLNWLLERLIFQPQDWTAATGTPTPEFSDQALRLNGHEFDKVISVSDYIADAFTIGPTDTSLSELGPRVAKIGVVLKSRLETCPRAGCYKKTGQSNAEAFWQTHFMTSNHNQNMVREACDTDRRTLDESHIIRLSNQLLMLGSTPGRREDKYPLHDDESHGQFRYNRTLGRAIRAWRLDSSMRMARTKQGYYCQVPWKTEVGDSIILCTGGKTPFAARRAEEPGSARWNLWGGCYVHGIMHGEGWEPEKAKEMWFD